MYALRITKRARSHIRAVPALYRDAVLKRIEDLTEEPRPSGVKKLKPGNTYRVRQGDYRILYEIDDTEKLVIINAVRDRKEAYR